MAYLTRVAGVYYGRHVYYDKGKRREVRKSLRTREERVAHRRLNEWESEIEGARWGEQPSITFATAATRWIHERCRHLKPASIRRYETSLAQLRPVFGDVMLAKIDGAALAKFEARRRRDPGRSWAPGQKGERKARTTSSSIMRDFACLSSLMSWAALMKWVPSNPVPAYLKEHGRALKKVVARTRYLSHEEESRLLAAARADRNASPHMREMLASAISFAIDTGLRLEEQMSLEWRDVQRGARPTIAVRETKTGVPRKVPLLPRALEVVDRLPMPPDARYVFWRGKGERFGSMKTAFLAACKRARLDDITWHDLRRTCGCRLLQDRKLGMSRVKLWLGHASIAMTEKHYAFLGIETLLDEVELTNPVAPVATADILPLRRAAG